MPSSTKPLARRKDTRIRIQERQEKFTKSSSLNEVPTLTRIKELAKKAEGASSTHEQVVKELKKVIAEDASTTFESSAPAGGDGTATSKDPQRRRSCLRLWSSPWNAEGVRVVIATAISGQL